MRLQAVIPQQARPFGAALRLQVMPAVGQPQPDVFKSPGTEGASHTGRRAWWAQPRPSWEVKPAIRQHLRKLQAPLSVRKTRLYRMRSATVENRNLNRLSANIQAHGPLCVGMWIVTLRAIFLTCKKRR
jgi:hypothetical protein